MNHRASPNLSPRTHQVSLQLVEADPEDFSRRLNISGSKRPAHTSPRPAHNTSKNNNLFNPQTDPIPMRRTAGPESISDATSSSYAPRGMSANPPGVQRETSAHQHQLFDHRKDDPVRFSVLAGPSFTNDSRWPYPKTSADYLSASSTSSYAPSQVSSTFTLSSNTTDGSSASSAVFDRPTEEPSNNAFAVQLKKLCRGISAAEGR
jgi:protein SMG6